MRLPKKLGDLIDLGKKLEEERISFQREMDEKIAGMKAKEKEVDEAVLAALEAAGMEKGTGSSATATLNKSPVPTVKDWPALWAHIQKTGEFDLLEKRVGKTAYRERIDNGKRVPGVETFWQKSISYSKFNGKA